MKKHLIAAALLVIAAAGTFFGLEATKSSSLGPRDTVVRFATDISKSNFYDACGYVSADILKADKQNVEQFAKYPFTPRRACALAFAAAAGGAIQQGADISNGFAIGDKPLTSAQIKRLQIAAPKNGLVYAAHYIQTDVDPFFGTATKSAKTIYIEVQRDSNGKWKVVGIE